MTTLTRPTISASWRLSAGVLAATAVASVLGAGMVASGHGGVAIALGALPLSLFVLPRLSRAAALPVGYFAIEVPFVLLLGSTLVFRIRDAEALAENPLDSAAQVRLACIGGAALLGWVALLRRPITLERAAIPPAVFLFGVYVAVVFLGAPLSLDLPLTAYRGVELAVGMLVVVAAVSFAAGEALWRLERVLYGFVVFLVGSVWLGVLVFPNEAVLRDVEPIPFQLQGVYPAVASNGVGEMGAILLLWSLGLRVSGRSVGRLNLALIAVGAVTLVAGQYRTGYLAVAFALTLLLATRGRRWLALLALVGVLAAAFWSASALTRAAEPYVLRGDSREEARELSGRLDYWDHAIPVWRESPVLGKGLLTGTRFEVLAPLGHTTTSTIHSTWIEALVGTGLVGLALLATALALLWRSALRDLLSPQGLVYPALLVAFVTVRSFTGPTFEVFGTTSLLLLVLAFVLHRRERDARLALGQVRA